MPVDLELQPMASKIERSTNDQTPQQDFEESHAPVISNQSREVIETISRNLVGENCPFESPFGTKFISYGDFTASGKSLACIEEFIKKQVLPFYGNTHTTSSVTGLQSTSFREEARELIAKAVNAHTTEGKDVVLFTGQGTTYAINKLVSALKLNRSRTRTMRNHRPIVFVGPFEHHANLLPWRESSADVVQIPEDKDGRVDTNVLIEQLRKHANRPLKIGSFAAASNLTGVLTDVDKVSTILHQHGALAFWDYATCAPYVKIDMNPASNDDELRRFAYKDAVFMSGHKFVGGPGTPGVLVVKRNLIDNKVPTTPAGGTVFFVTKNGHRYLDDLVEREEAGTPDVIGSIRLGLAFQMKMRVGTRAIMELERYHAKHIRAELESHENIEVLGKRGLDNLPIFSFLIRFGQRYLHYNFVCALLNDLFGIQARGGCQCAGPFAVRLLGVSDESINSFERSLGDKPEAILKPGFSRISFPYFMPDDEVEYIVDAIKFVASHGWKFLPVYRFEKETGAWFHESRTSCKTFVSRKWLANFDPAMFPKPGGGSRSLNPQWSSNQFDSTIPTSAATGGCQDLEIIRNHRQENLVNASLLAEQMRYYDLFSNEREETDRKGMLNPKSEAFRWFAYPKEGYDMLRWNQEPEPEDKLLGPVQPQRYQNDRKGCELVELYASRHSEGASTPTASRTEHPRYENQARYESRPQEAPVKNKVRHMFSRLGMKNEVP